MKIGTAVTLLYPNGARWTVGRVSALRADDLSVKPDHVKVHVPGRGVYNMPLSRVRVGIDWTSDEA